MKKLNAVGANIFAGGFTVGVSRHFNILAHLEHDDYGVEVARANFTKLPVFIGPSSWPERPNPAKPIHFLYSNPPCAIWSLAGNRVGRIDWRTDPRLERVRDIFTLVERYRPHVWCWESVCQAFEKGREFVEDLAGEAAKLGYATSYVLIDAQYLRAPQTRKRFFLVLHRVAIDWEKARPDFDAPPVLPRDVLKGVKPNLYDNPRVHQFAATEIGKQMQRVLAATPPGGRLAGTFEQMSEKGKIKRIKTDRGTTLGKPSFLAYRIDPDKLCGVIFGDKTFHHKKARHLALNELGVLHGFPPTYDWVNNSHRLDIQRGVLPPVGEWLARHVAAAIRANKPVTSRAGGARPMPRTLIDFRRTPGEIQDVLALPRSVDLDWKPGVGPTKGDRTANPLATEPAGRPRRARSAVRRDPPAGSASSAPGVGKKANKIKNIASTARSAAPKGEKKPRKIKDLGDVRATSRALLAGVARGVRPPTSGELLRARILEGKLDDEAMAAEVRKLWPGRTTSKSDVAWNRGMLKKSGVLR